MLPSYTLRLFRGRDISEEDITEEMIKEAEIALDEKQTGYKYGQEVKVLLLSNNTVVDGTVVGMISKRKQTISTNFPDPNSPQTITVKFTSTTPVALLISNEGLNKEIKFIAKTGVPLWEGFREKYRLLK